VTRDAYKGRAAGGYCDGLEGMKRGLQLRMAANPRAQVHKFRINREPGSQADWFVAGHGQPKSDPQCLK